MKTLYLLYTTVLLTSFVVGGAVLYVYHSRQSPSEAEYQARQANGFQCAHWSVFRSCQLLGVPVGQEALVHALPPAPKGHSLAQVSEVLAALGIDSEGHHEDWKSLSTATFPCIAHLRNPDHYVVISGIEPEKGYIHIFDGDGLRTRRTRAAFEDRWSGITLRLTRCDTEKDFGASIHLDHLLLDKGDVPAVGKPVEFAFPLRNTGKRDLVIKQVRVHCSCLNSERPEAPIRPGESAVIRLFYDIAPKSGPFSQTALVTTNDETVPFFVLTACGYAGVEVRLTTPRVTLKDLYVGQDCTADCVLRYTGEWKEFQAEVEGVAIKNAALVSHRCRIPEASDPQVWELDREFTNRALSDVRKDAVRLLELTFRPTGRLNDKVEGDVKVKTNIKGYEEFVVHIVGEITSPIQCYPSILYYDNLPANADTVKRQVALVSPRGDSFRISDVRLGDDVLPEAAFTNRFVDEKTDITFLLSSDFVLSHNGQTIVVNVELKSSDQKLSLPLKIVARTARDAKSQ